MKAFHHFRLVTLGLFLTFAAAFSASAQNYAADSFRKAMADLGSTAHYAMTPHTRYAKSTNAEGEFNGLRLSGVHARVDGGYGWAIIYYVENQSDKPYCIRPKPMGLPRGEKYYVQTVNQIVEPYSKLMIVDIRDRGYLGDITVSLPFAFWPPNYDAPEGSYCRSVAPEGLQEWLDEPGVKWFYNSRRD